MRNNKDLHAIVNDESAAFAKASIIGGGFNVISVRGHAGEGYAADVAPKDKGH